MRFHTEFFTFGEGHCHEINGTVYDKDVILKITANDPRAVMFGLFGVEWSMCYTQPPDAKFYPRGTIELPDRNAKVLREERDCWLATAKNLQAQVNGWEAERTALIAKIKSYEHSKPMAE
jgi:hypothetical protein